jgi:hypothetical protein
MTTEDNKAKENPPPEKYEIFKDIEKHKEKPIDINIEISSDDNNVEIKKTWSF